jgi:hypothetical protein
MPAKIVQATGEGKDGTTTHSGPFLVLTAKTSRTREN